MKSLITLIACTALMAGCARHRETGQGAGGYDTGGSMGTSTNGTGTTISPSQGGAGTGTQGGTTDQGTGTGTTPTPAAPNGTP